ncbi:MAG: hypothetical protein JOZ48_00890 [Acidobacteriaceae bacterium]|nr:hypothetical protein [Acidobacteriaceae bacterium]
MHQELLGVNIWESDHCGDRQKLRVSGHTIADADLACVSTLPHAHSIPNGKYGFQDEESPEPTYAAGAKAGRKKSGPT